MARLPNPGSDEGTWGDILNDFLTQSFNTDGTIKEDAVAGIQGQPVSAATPNDGDVLTYDAGTGQWMPMTAGSVPDASAGQKGVIQLAGDLGGTAASPTVPGKQPLNADLTVIAGLAPSNDDILQRKSGAWANRTPAQVKTDLALTKTDVGLANVDNTTDANKPISTATQTALNQKGVLAYNVYTSTAGDTWNKPTGAKVIEVFVIGAGGGGGKGASAAAGGVRHGGGGGGAGGAVMGQFDATTITSTVAITVGAGGTAGTNPTGTGGTGGSSSFGAYVSAGGGTGGGGGAFALGPFGGSGGTSSLIVGAGATAVTGTFAASGGNGHAGAGAQGTSIDASNAPNGLVGNGGNSPAGAGGVSRRLATDGAAGNGIAGSGTNGGSGGGGGGASTTTNGGTGGNGGASGGGGGGGGAGTTAGLGGDGGTGGNGAVIVITYG